MFNNTAPKLRLFTTSAMLAFGVFGARAQTADSTASSVDTTNTYMQNGFRFSNEMKVFTEGVTFREVTYEMYDGDFKQLRGYNADSTVFALMEDTDNDGRYDIYDLNSWKAESGCGVTLEITGQYPGEGYSPKNKHFHALAGCAANNATVILDPSIKNDVAYLKNTARFALDGTLGKEFVSHCCLKQ
jgi:hypothetical protein